MNRRSFACSFLACVGLVAFSLAFQGSRGVWEPDEGRYTNIATQMVRSGNFVEPAWNDDFSHFAKPPLTYWAVVGGISVLGWNEWGARLPNAVAFVVTVLLVLALARRLTPDRPWLPAVVYATALLPYAAANIVTTDTLLTMFETLAMYSFVVWYERRDRPRAWRWLLLAWGGFGLAFLTKGPPGLLPLLGVVAFLALAGEPRSLRRFLDSRGLATFVVVGFSWYAVVLARRPELLEYFLRDEVVARIASGKHRRNAAWYGAIVTYLPTFLVGFLPWTLFLLRPLRRLPALLRRGWWRAEAAERPWRLFVLLWAVAPLAVFAVSRSRLPFYVLPLFVPLALLVGMRLERRPLPGRTAVAALAAWCLLLAGLRWGAAAVPNPQDSRPLARAIEALPGPAPAEVVFVEGRASWGLSLYLDAEVERVLMHSELPGEAQSFAEELTEQEHDQLFVVGEANVREFTRLAGGLGMAVEPVGGFGAKRFLRLLPRTGVPAAPR